MMLRELLHRKKVQQQDLAKSIGLDEPMVSKFINYKCLPIPNDMKQICKRLNCDIEDIYKDDEVFYKKACSKTNTNTKDNELTNYNLSVRLPRSAKNFLTKENLQKCGYKDITYWIYRCYERLLKQFEIITQKEKDRIDADTSNTAKGNK